MKLLKEIIFCVCLSVAAPLFGAVEYEPFADPVFLNELGVSDNNNPVTISLESGSFSDPVLYGPGGDPIGGLPVENSTWLLFGAAVVYVGCRCFAKRRR